MMFGYATRETPELMPMPIALAHKLAHRLAEVRRGEVVPYLRPDGKTQVTVRYEHGRPIEIEKILISTQHKDGVDADTLIRPDLWEHVVHPVLPGELYDERKLNTKSNFFVNPTGRFVIGGPVGDAGLTGRKIIVDTYGGAARHGGGAFSGKDPSKVDRSAAYAARHVAKNVVAAGLADRCEVQVAYAIGVAHPVSLMVETFGTGKLAGRRDRDARRATSSTCARPRSAATSTSTGRSTRRPRPTATSAATTTTSPGSASTRPTRCATPQELGRPRLGSRAERLLAAARLRSRLCRTSGRAAGPSRQCCPPRRGRNARASAIAAVLGGRGAAWRGRRSMSAVGSARRGAAIRRQVGSHGVAESRRPTSAASRRSPTPCTAPAGPGARASGRVAVSGAAPPAHRRCIRRSSRSPACGDRRAR